MNPFRTGVIIAKCAKGSGSASGMHVKPCFRLQGCVCFAPRGTRLCSSKPETKVKKVKPKIVEATQPGAFMQWDDGYFVRRLEKEEALGVRDYFGSIGPVGKDDFQLAWECASPEEGSGFYAGEYEGKLVASTHYIKLLPGLYNSGGVFVDTSYRGKGFMPRLLGCGLDNSPGISMGDAYSHMRNKVEPFGFVQRWWTHQFQGHVPILSSLPEGVVDVSTVPYEKLYAYDNKRYLAPDTEFRQRLLPKWISLEGGATFVALDEKEDIVGYISRRPGIPAQYHFVGPWYAENDQIAEKLLRALGYGVKETDAHLLEVWELSKGAMKFMKKYNFTKVADLMHMETEPRDDFKPTTYAITSADVCPF